MNQYIIDPKWWSQENEAAWERVRPAMKREWDETEHDVETSGNPDTNSISSHMARQARGKQATLPQNQLTYEEMEPAYRFGYGARLAYRAEYPQWDDLLERRLREDWRILDPARNHRWEKFRDAVRFGWDFDDEDFEDVDHR